MKHIRTLGVFILLFTILLSGCSAESIMEQGSELLDKIFAGDPSEPRMSVAQGPAASSKPNTAAQEPESTPSSEAAEPSVPAPSPASSEPPAPEQPASAASPSVPAETITPSHTDATFFGPGESFKYLPKGVGGVYACTYTSEDESIASVDSDTGKVTAVGPGTTKIKMHLEYNGQYDFECIVRCNWKDSEKQPAQSGESSGPVLPSVSAKPADSPVSNGGAISASHSDATFFNPKEHFQFLPVGTGDGYTCSYATGDANIASVDEKGVVTAVGPGTTTVTMTLDGGGTEYTFKCIVRCNWD